MAISEVLELGSIKKIIQEINEEEEVARRANAKKRHEIYLDGGKEYLIEQIRREFNEDAVKEMRLCPINILKKIVTKKASIYKQPPVRKTELESDQALMDFYVEQLSFDQLMMKAHRYYHLFSNTAMYFVPDMDGNIKGLVVPPFLYSIVPNKIDQTQVDMWVFNAFIEEGEFIKNSDLPSPTGQGWSSEFGLKKEGDLLSSNEKDRGSSRQYVFWSDLNHFTADETGAILFVDKGEDSEMQVLNPIAISPVINIAKDRDNQAWATQGEDVIDLSIAFQMGWTDLLTTTKHQSFGILTIISEEEPQKLTIGVNRAIWLKQNPESSNQPSISYVQANPPLAETKDNLLDLLSLLLTTNDMPNNAMGGVNSVKNVNSGFQALIEMADTLEVIEQDKPVLRDVEKQAWDIISKWHNFMFDTAQLNEEAMSLGRFSDEFTVSIQYQDIKPIESEQERIANVEKLVALGLVTRKDALKKLYPDMSSEEIDAKLKEIDAESKARVGLFTGNQGVDDEEGQV